MTLPEYIEEYRNKPFEWGVNDCVIFAIGWIDKSTGNTFVSEYFSKLGRWNCKKSAYKAIKIVNSLEEEFSERLTKIDPNFATDGDIGIINLEGGYKACGVFSGRFVVCVGYEGLIFKERGEALCAWRYL